MVLIIALVPAILVLLIAIGSESKTKTGWAAAAAIAVGVFTGNPAYTLLDVGAVVGALVLAWNFVPFKTVVQPVRAPQSTSKGVQKTAGESTGFLVVLLAAAGIAIFGSLNKNTAPVQQPASPAPQIRQSQPPTPPRAPVALTRGAPKQAQKSKAPAKSPLQRCLEILSDDKMAACLEGVK